MLGQADDQIETPTVATKLRVPPTPRYLITRKRLLDALDRGIDEHLVLLSAPAGAGKTVLLSSWVGTRKLPGPVCWLTLDADDNDASRLIADLLSALRGARTAVAGSALDRLTPPTGGRTERFLPLLINCLAELPPPVVVVLDEIPELVSPEATATLDFLVRHAPEQCRLVLAGRADPAFPVERYRMSGELTELRVADLAFDRRETAELCNRLGLELSGAEIDSLWGRTEGWAAALRLAALSLSGHSDPARFLAELAGTEHAIADYLVAEVLSRLPVDRREFMLRTCVVDTISGELADALTEGEGGALKLAALERSGAPMQHIAGVEGGGEDWYRYHPLFRELMRAHLRYSHPRQVASLHSRAAAWYAAHGQTMSAIRHALAGGDWERAGGLIAENWLWLFLRGSSAAMCTPMARLSAEVVAGDPRLGAAFAGSRLQDGDLQSAEWHLANARRAYGETDEAGGREVRGHEVRGREARGHEGVGREAGGQLDLTLTVVGLHDARLRGRVKDVERLAQRLFRSMPAYPPAQWGALRGFGLCTLGSVRLWCGDVEGALPALQEGLALSTEVGYDHLVLDCLAQLATIDLLEDRLTNALERGERAVELAERGGWGEGPAVACAYMARAVVAYRCGEFERAEGLSSHALSAAGTAEMPVRHAVGVVHALVLAAAGSRSAARGALKLRAVRAAMAQQGEPRAIPEFLSIALVDAEARVLGAAGELEQARAALGRVRRPRCGLLIVRRAALQLREGDREGASSTLSEALPDSAGETGGSPDLPASVAIEAWLLRALLEQEDGRQRASVESLDRALGLAESEPYLDAFLLGGEGVRRLLEHQARTGTAHPALLEVLLDGVSQRRGGKVTLAEPLTEREQRVLRYLPTMLSNAEIGSEMFVSLNTVKTHLRGIYRKLDANSRADAVEKARGLGLLPSGIRRPKVLQRM
jgi:LuxR family transcriptional regulator, maltose regulon positive regulatory protein